MRLRWPFPESEHRVLAWFVITFGLTVTAWASAHDLYLIGVEPRHFTEFHVPLLPISDLRLLAIQYAVIATLGPGMALGAMAFAICRLGSRMPHSLITAWRLFLPFIAIIEATSWIVGKLAVARLNAGELLPYPETLYPENTPGIVYTQSVNITAYIAAIIFAGIYLITLWLLRKPATTLTQTP
jgi:hypothetical protein